MPEENLAAAWDRVTVPLAATTVVKRIETFRAEPYDDNPSLPDGTWTIGYGTIVDAQEKPVTRDTQAITQPQANALLERDMGAAAKAVDRLIPGALLVREAAALISWTYNLGEGSLQGSTLRTRLNAGDKAAVPAEMRKWINQKGKPLTGLLRRRWAEAAIFLGVDPTLACERAWATIHAPTDWPSFDA